MSYKNVISEGEGFVEGLRVGYAENESRIDTSYYWENANRGGDHAIIQYTQSGVGFFNDSEQSYEVSAGWAFITEVPSQTSYGYPQGASEPYEISFLALYGHHAIRLARDFRARYGPVIDFSQRPESYSLFREVSSRYAQRSFRDRIEESTLLYQLFGALYREAGIEAVRGDVVATCYQRIQTRFRELANINEIAHDANVSREHLTRSFRERYGQTPSRMLRDLRIREARMVIKSGVENLEAVAQAVGFSDVRTLRRYL